MASLVISLSPFPSRPNSSRVSISTSIGPYMGSQMTLPFSAWRKYHSRLKCVSKRWRERELVCGEEWQYYRRKHNLDETWIYCLCRNKFEQICDPSSPSRCWKLIQGLPPRSSKRKGMAFEVLGKKVYLLGGCGWSEDATDEVHCYDASMNTWE